MDGPQRPSLGSTPPRSPCRPSGVGLLIQRGRLPTFANMFETYGGPTTAITDDRRKDRLSGEPRDRGRDASRSLSYESAFSHGAMLIDRRSPDWAWRLSARPDRASPDGYPDAAPAGSDDTAPTAPAQPCPRHRPARSSRAELPTPSLPRHERDELSGFRTIRCVCAG
jgi:hypothetical protein